MKQGFLILTMMLLFTQHVKAQENSPIEGSITYQTKNEVYELLKKSIRPEFLNRIDHRILFNPLTPKAMSAIVSLELQELIQRLKTQKIKCSVSAAVKKQIGKLSWLLLWAKKLVM